MVAKEIILQWIAEGYLQKATHVIIIEDQPAHDFFPVLVFPYEDVKIKVKTFEHYHMNRIMGVYDLSMDIDKQINEVNSRNY